MSPRQIISSVANYLNTNLKNYGSVYIDSLDVLDENSYPRFDIKIDGPNIERTTKNFRIINIEVYIMVISKDDSNKLDHFNLLQVASNCLENQILVSNENNQVIDCFQPMGDILITPYGTVINNQSIVQTSVERRFSVHTGA